MVFELLAPRHPMAPHTLAYYTFRMIKPFGLLGRFIVFDLLAPRHAPGRRPVPPYTLSGYI